MSFGQELKDFTAGFNTTYNAMSDRRDKKWARDRAAIEDPINNDYKKAATEGMRQRNKWYEPIADLQVRTGENNLKWADRDHQSVIDAREANLYANVFGPHGRGKPGEVLSGDTPDGAPDSSGAPVGGVGDHATESAIPAPDDSSSDTTSDTDTGGADTGGDEAPAAENMSYRPGGPANSQGDIYARFMQTVYKAGVKNPNGLAAIAATANRESKFAPANAYGRWSDPSQSGGAGTAGGIMSWRGDRYAGLQQFAAKNHDDPNRPSPETQAMYLFHEDPSLKDKLNAARTPQQAQQIMNNAWAFAGYDSDSPERRARFGLANTYASKYNEYLGGTQALATGGYVVHAATGGAIPDDPNDPNNPQPMQVAQATPVPAPQQALPMNAPVPPQRPVDQPTPQGDTSGGNASPADVGYDPSVASNPRVVGFTKAHEAVLDGIRYSLQQVGLDQGAAVTDPARAQKMAEFLKGAGAAPKAIIDQAYEAVDPKHELPDSERTMAALGTVYDHYLKRGEPQKAKAAAASIVQYQRKLFQQYSSIAKAAVADGDIDAATKAAVKAYASVPDGQDMTVKKLDDGRYQINITDEATGKTVSKPVLTPEEIGGWAMKVSPGTFDQFIMDAAGQRKQGGGAPSEDFQKLAAGLDDGKMPSNKEMAALPMAEQKELRMRVAAAQKASGAGGAKPPTYSESNKVRGDMTPVYDQMAGETMPNSEELVHKGMGDIPSSDKKAITDAAADIVGSPKNRSQDYNVSETDAISAAFVVSQGGDYKAADKNGGKQITLSDGTEVWMPSPRFARLLSINKRAIADAKKTAQDKTNANEDSAAKSKASNKRAGQYEKDNPAFMAPPGTQPPPPSSGIPAGGSWDSPLGAPPQGALDDLQKLMQ